MLEMRLVIAEHGRVRMRVMHGERRKTMMMRRAARQSDGRGESLHRECKHKQPQQKNTNRAVHRASLSRVRHTVPACPESFIWINRKHPGSLLTACQRLFLMASVHVTVSCSDM